MYVGSMLVTWSHIDNDHRKLEAYDVSSTINISHSGSRASSVSTNISSASTLLLDPLTTKQRANIAHWIKTTPGYESMEEEMKKKSCNNSEETLANEDLSPFQLEAVPSFPRPSLTGSSLYGLQCQLRCPRMSIFTELFDEDSIDPRLVPVVADSDSDINNCLRPFCHSPTSTPFWAEGPESEFTIILIGQSMSKKARQVASRGVQACRGLRKKLSRDKELDKSD
jgi:hypothetical protein